MVDLEKAFEMMWHEKGTCVIHYEGVCFQSGNTLDPGMRRPTELILTPHYEYAPTFYYKQNGTQCYI